MTTTELHKILDDENKKLSLKELTDVIFELQTDCMNMGWEACKKPFKDLHAEYYNKGYYNGEQNAFHLCLRLLEHLDD